MVSTLQRPRSLRRAVNVSTAVESLEPKIVLSAIAAAPAPAALDGPIATVTDITVNSVEIVENQLVANATIVGSVLGQAFTEDVQIPLEVTGSPNPEGGCDILNLSLGPVNLELLGLEVNLDDCNGGPVTLDITGEEGPGNLLGNLVCDVAGLLDGGLDLGGVLDGLTTEQLAQFDQLVGGLTDTLNDMFGQLLASGDDVTTAVHQADSTNILDLSVGPLDLDLLGLQVETSEICLVVDANQGSGNLLGNLVGSIAHLLDRDPGNAIDAFLRRADRILDGLFDDVNEDLMSGKRGGR